MAELAAAMFSQWVRKNVLRYMRQHFALDALSTCNLDELDPENVVVCTTKPDARLRQNSPRCAPPPTPNLLARKKSTPELKREIKDLEDCLDILRTVAKTEKPHCHAGDLGEIECLDGLPSCERLFLDVIRMFAYRAEARMTLQSIHDQGK